MLETAEAGGGLHRCVPLLLTALIGCTAPPGAPAPGSDREAILAAGRAFSAGRRLRPTSPGVPNTANSHTV